MIEIKYRGRFVFEGNELYDAVDEYKYGFPYCNDAGEWWIRKGNRSFICEKDTIKQYLNAKDILGNEIYEGDEVYLAGLGYTEMVFPYLELYEALAEGDVGEIRPEGDVPND